MRAVVFFGAVILSVFSLSILPFFGQVQEQDLLGERIRKITPVKKSVFLDRGIFHNGREKNPSVLKAIRHSYVAKNGYERLVFDFSSGKIPRVYGHISSKEHKLYIDFFDTKLSHDVGSFGKTHFVEDINFFAAGEEAVSMEMVFNRKTSIDVFYLEGPGRLVVDVKE